MLEIEKHCPDCGGTGIENPVPLSANDNECHRCHGTGKVIRETSPPKQNWGTYRGRDLSELKKSELADIINEICTRHEAEIKQARADRDMWMELVKPKNGFLSLEIPNPAILIFVLIVIGLGLGVSIWNIFKFFKGI